MRSFIFMISVAFMLLIAACASAPIKPVEFAIEPQTPDEKAVAQMLEAYVKGWNEHRVGNEQDIEQFSSFYAPEAKIDSLVAGEVVSRAGNKAAILAMRDPNYSKIALRKVRINLLPQDRAHVDSQMRIFGPPETQYPFIVDLVHRGGQWLILEQKQH
jgi:hypothetical protein